MLPTTHLLSYFTVTEFIFLMGKQSLGCFKIIPKLVNEGEKPSHLKKTELKYYFSHSSDDTDVSHPSSLSLAVLLNVENEISRLLESSGLLTILLNRILESGKI